MDRADGLRTPSLPGRSWAWPSWHPRPLLRGSVEGYLTFGLLAFLWLMAALSLDRGRWVPQLPSLVPVLLLALALGRALAPRPWPRALHHLLALTLGLGVALAQGARMMPGPGWLSQGQQLLSQVGSWFQAAAGGGSNQGAVAFSLFLIALTWALGYLSSWLIFRGHRAWWAILPAGLVLLVNLNYLPQGFSKYFFLYLLASVLLLAHDWRRRRGRGLGSPGLGSPGLASAYFLGHALGLGLAALALAWLLPPAQASPLSYLWDNMGSPRNAIQNQFERLFSSVTMKKPLFAIESPERMPFGGDYDTGERVMFLADSEQPRKWSLRSYDLYTSWGWVSTPGVKLIGPQTLEPSPPSPEGLAPRQLETDTISLAVHTRALVSAGEPRGYSLPVEVELRPAQTFALDLSGPGEDASLPPDLAALLPDLSARAASGALSEPELLQALPSDLQVLGIAWEEGRMLKVEVARREWGSGDVAGVKRESRILLRPGQKYTVTSALPTATPQELRAAGESYPEWVAKRYLQLPEEIRPWLIPLSRAVGGRAPTPYDKALAVKEYLGRFPYKLDVAPPPPGKDGVEYFLFDLQAGYCEHFASAMTVMLRALGVPARFVVGYAGGDWDAGLEAWVVRERSAHAWVEAYFPGYGWIDFDPTPSGPSDPARQVDEVGLDTGEFDFPPEESQAGPSLKPGASLSFPWRDMAITLAVFLFLAWAWRWWLQVPSARTYPQQVYARMCWLATLARRKPRAQLTPWEFAQRLAASLPSQAGAIDSVTGAYLRDQYARRKALSKEERRELGQAWRSLRWRLVLHIFRWR